jgi:hypothetical protein
MPFMPGRDDLALIPPLELPQTDCRDIGNLRGGITSFIGLKFGAGLAGFVNIGRLTDCTRPEGVVNKGVLSRILGTCAGGAKNV